MITRLAYAILAFDLVLVALVWLAPTPVFHVIWGIIVVILLCALLYALIYRFLRGSRL